MVPIGLTSLKAKMAANANPAARFSQLLGWRGRRASSQGRPRDRPSSQRVGVRWYHSGLDTERDRAESGDFVWNGGGVEI